MTKTYLQTKGNINDLRLPSTRKCTVIYRRDGDSTNYSKIISTPRSLDGLHMAMLACGVALRQITTIRPV